MTDRIGAPLTDAQRAFVQTAESLGATAPGGALRLTELPRLSARELDALVEAGLVREAADWTYYVFQSRRPPAASSAVRYAYGAPPAVGRTFGRRAVRSLVFWIIVILIPVLFLQLTNRR